jgi:hypothetical protein
MEDNSEIIRFQFDNNYKDIIESSSIVRDFDKFIEMANDGLLELSKNGILSMSSAILVNETILRKISVRLRRPMIKSFPNVLSLFVLFSFSGLRKIEIKGKKKYLRVNIQMLEQWKQFSDVEKYFSLFSLTFTNFTFDPINERDGVFEFDLVMKIIADMKGKLEANKSNEYYFNMYQFKTILITLNMLGLIDIEDAPQLENQGWNIRSIQSKNFMCEKWDIINKLRTYCLFSRSDDDEEYSEDCRFTIGDVDEIARNQRFADKITERIPEFSKRLKMDMENRPGIYYFKAKHGKTWRIHKVDYRSSLDNLCYSILNSFDFDFDHLYDVTFMSSFGYSLTFNGAPEISYAEYPTTEDILIGDLPIKINDKMNFTFDYGDNWQFSILLEKIEVIKKEANEIPEIEIIKINGKAPEQYASWD